MAFNDPMPSNWDDMAGWNVYYAALHEAKEHLDNLHITFDLMEASHFIESLLKAQHTKIWFSGCGASVAPHVYAALGFEVWASDFAEEAIKIQQELKDTPLEKYVPAEQVQKIPPERSAKGKLQIFTHDFRQPLKDHQFDCILNIKSFQALPIASMKSAAKTHYNALAPGRQAIFSTMNVQGERRDWIEDALVEAGFLVPFHETNRWYRKTLADTGIPHVFILGRPMVMGGRERYPDSSDQQRIADQEKLSSFSEEYRQRMEKEHDKIQATLNSSKDIKIANVIYNTG